jgi:protein SCO1
MKLLIALISLLLAAPAAYAEMEMHHHHGHDAVLEAPQAPAPGSQRTDKGLFVLELTVKGKTLKTGPNSVEIALRDAEGKAVEGAQFNVVPWMPDMGHGVWDKPVVTERPGGNYHVENVVLIMSGRWDLKVTARKGGSEDRAVFSFEVAEDEQAAKEPAAEPEPPANGYERSVKYYNPPNVTLLNQDGQKVNLRALLDSGKPVIVDFIFTTCTTICPVLTATLASMRSELGDNAGNLQLISVSIDPENDRPERLKEYRARFNGGSDWQFLTGSRDEVGRVLKAFDAFIVDKMSHEPLYLLHGANSDHWVRIKGLVKKADLVKEYRRMEAK